MNDKVYKVLFICTHNSARPIVAEAPLNNAGRGGFVAYSAGGQPRGEVRPLASLDRLALQREVREIGTR